MENELKVLLECLAKGLEIDKSIADDHKVSWQGIAEKLLNSVRENCSNSVSEIIVLESESLTEKTHSPIIAVLLSVLNRISDSIKFLEDNCVEDGSNQPSSSGSVPSLILSVKDQNVIGKAVEFLVAFGTSPCLSAGVGLPVDQRSTHGSMLMPLLQLADKPEEVKTATLVECGECIWGLTGRNDMRDSLISRHLEDILAVLFQLGFGTKATILSQLENHDVIELCRSRLILLKRNIYIPSLMRAVLYLLHGQPNESGITSSPVNSPKWLQIGCGRYLTQLLMEPNGVYFCLQTVSDMSQEPITLFARSEAIAKVIATCPQALAKRANEYFENVCRQLKTLLVTSVTQDDVSEEFRMIVIVCCRTMAESQSLIAETVIVTPLLNPLLWLDLTKTTDVLQPNVCDETKPVTKDEILIGVKVAFYWSTLGPVTESKTVECISTYFVTIFDFYCALAGRASVMTTLLEDILLKILAVSNSRHELVCNVFEETSGLLSLDHLVQNCSPVEMQRRLVAVPDVDISGFGLEWQTLNWESASGSLEVRIDGLLRLLTKFQSQSQQLATDLIARLIVKTTGLLLESGEMQSNTTEGGFVELANLSVAAMLLEKFPDIMITEVGTLWELCEIYLRRSSSHASSDSELKFPTGEKYRIVFGILTVLIMADQFNDLSGSKKPTLTPDVVSNRQSILRSLKRVSEFGPTSDIRGQALDLLTLMTEDANLSNASKSNTKTDQLSSFTSAMMDLKDVIVPTKGHALITLKSLVVQKDSETMQNIDEVLKVATDCLRATEESFIYLAAINLLAELGSVASERVIPVLVAQFVGDYTAVANPEIKLNLGEAIMRISRNLGDFGPFYGGEMLDQFLGLVAQAKDDEFVRASSLANVGEICKLMQFKLTDYIKEIMLCVNGTLEWDSRDVVRRAAVHTLRMILEGTDVRILEILGDTMLDIYRTVKKCERDPDEVVRLHADLCRQQIDSNLKNLIQSEMNQLIREIRIK